VAFDVPTRIGHPQAQGAGAFLELAVAARTPQLRATFLELSKHSKILAIQLEDAFAKFSESEAIGLNLRELVNENKRLSDLPIWKKYFDTPFRNLHHLSKDPGIAHDTIVQIIRLLARRPDREDDRHEFGGHPLPTATPGGRRYGHRECRDPAILRAAELSPSENRARDRFR
jgi:hypothetical protein